MARIKLLIGTAKRRSASAPAYVARARRTPTANALAIALFALAGLAATET